MCGRFALGVNLNDLPAEFTNTVYNQGGGGDRENTSRNELINSSEGVYNSEVRGSEEDLIRIQFDSSRVQRWDGSYNIAPTNTGLIVYMINTSNVDYSYVLEPSKFGMVPFWAKPNDPTATANGGKYSKELQRTESRYFNCRKESLESGQAVWSSSKKRNRCVVPIQGYFEWLKSKSEKTPHYIHSTKSSLIYLAGMYSHNSNYTENYNVKSEYLSSFTIVTGPAISTDTGDISWLHERKPILLEPGTKAWYDWLDPNKPWSDSMLKDVLDTTHNKAYIDIEGYPVSNDVGNPKNKGETNIKKQKKTQRDISSFFTPTKKRVKEEDSPETSAKKLKTENVGEVNSPTKANNHTTYVKKEE
ncbi:hypothetical protein DFJ63DRAFT_104718 [Scheffersomyces coipomensis]|uniref:uncharacterized protein n=1 Tax=Scheffersomyces coipomensis TaxID=1788519 RepID=UPI00315CF186